MELDDTTPTLVYAAIFQIRSLGFFYTLTSTEHSIYNWTWVLLQGLRVYRFLCFDVDCSMLLLYLHSFLDTRNVVFLSINKAHDTCLNCLSKFYSIKFPWIANGYQW